MAVTPVVIAINSSGIETAKKLASVIGAKAVSYTHLTLPTKRIV